jgi:hypothetical protein
MKWSLRHIRAQTPRAEEEGIPVNVSPSAAVLLLAWLLFAVATTGRADTPPPVLPEGNAGIAARYPGDAGIEKDPAVVLHADFEDCRTTADLTRTWDVMYGQEHMRITEEPADVNGGSRALEMTIPQQMRSLSVDVGRTLAQTRDVLFLRFYTKLQKGFDIPQTSSHNGGCISSRYYPGGRATPGKRADGHNKFIANFENEIGWRGEYPSPGPLNVYIYHPEQRSDYGDHFFPTGVIQPNTSLPHNFGPYFVPRPDVVPQLDRWYCLEYMVKANTPGQRDGRIALWVDGKLIADFPNLRLRDTEELKIDRFDVCLFIADNSLRENKKWYDDIVAATSYIGPRVAAGTE